MNISRQFIERPVMTSLFMAALVIFGVFAYATLPVSELPNVDFPTISVNAFLPGADPETVASAVALPLENAFATIPGLVILLIRYGARTLSISSSDPGKCTILAAHRIGPALFEPGLHLIQPVQRRPVALALDMRLGAQTALAWRGGAFQEGQRQARRRRNAMRIVHGDALEETVRGRKMTPGNFILELMLTTNDFAAE